MQIRGVVDQAKEDQQIRKTYYEEASSTKINIGEDMSIHSFGSLYCVARRVSYMKKLPVLALYSEELLEVPTFIRMYLQGEK